MSDDGLTQATQRVMMMTAATMASDARPIAIIQMTEPPRRPPEHVHRWAWTVAGSVECPACGARQ